MKKIILLGLYVIASHAFAHSQSKSTQLPNGVIVHQAQGVEGVPEPHKDEQVRVRTIQDLNLAECIEALAQTELKLAEASDSDRERYLLGKAQLVQRINELKASN